MKVIVFEDHAYYKMLEEFSGMVKEAANGLKEDEQWLSTDEAKKLLGIKSKSKMQQLRDAGEIEFSQNGRIIKYYKPSLTAYLKRNVKH